ncbi:MAG: FAD-dependent oxidoreductase [Dehalococcoidia bacterium]|nr:FAD-dependent oxidoreductase [Dehalococcoidia bacterium]
MQLAFSFDQTRCVGCYTCGVACKDWHDIPAGPAHWRRVSHMEEGEFPNPFVAYLSAACNHCVNPICATVCPATAITKREQDGVVLVDQQKCREAAHCGIISGYEVGPAPTMGERRSPCQVTCPAHLKVPGYIALISKGLFDEALDLIRVNMPLPSVCGRICTHPCETVCKRQDLDEPIAISALRRFAADNATNHVSPMPVPRTKQGKVAIIGSGPAGLAAAYDLVRMGYGVTVFEALPVAGGMLAVGIPDYRLPKDILKREIDYIAGLGVEIKTNSPIGSAFTLHELAQQGYGATFIATGCHRSIKPDVPGTELSGTLDGVSFLRDLNLGKQVKVGEKVAVIGGGNVAIDAVRTALRLGAKEAFIVYRRTRKEMPATDEEIKQAEEEGVKFNYRLVPTRIVGVNGKVTGLECASVRSIRSGKQGKASVSIVDGSERVLAADTVIFAIGQAPDLDFVKAIGGLKLTERGTIEVDPVTMETSRPGIFAGGDAVSGAATAIEAIAAGQRAASHIRKFIEGEVVSGERPATEIRGSDIKVKIPADIVSAPRQVARTLPVDGRLVSFGEVTAGFDREAAMAEASRCLNCAGSLCRDACPYGVPQFGAEENAKMQMCNFCVDRLAENKLPVCVGSCPTRALDSGPVEEMRAKHGDGKEAAGHAFYWVTEAPTVVKPKDGFQVVPNVRK